MTLDWVDVSMGMLKEDGKPGQLIVISGPSGVGKGTLCRRLTAGFPNQLVWSVSATSRKPRPGEVHGVDYYFLSPDEFKQGIEQEHFLEWAEYNGNFYGTPKALVSRACASGKSVLLEIDVQGARHVRQAMTPQDFATLIFIAPPDMSTLRARLTERGTNTEDDIENRLKISAEEMTQQHHFDHVVMNDNLDTSYKKLCDVLGLNATS